ncbi:hypothetical protein RvY_19103 [Ramazzottius varieornatus]|uniref:Small ribosomal subunit protein mS40 n=1 Tax=Ramazzottius varieornatus TaxID=947166 RepID=A0A1D1W887_RAMVA|nr:hypothetical protein RvY_19103 [Ramazzottius varieornatus]
MNVSRAAVLRTLLVPSKNAFLAPFSLPAAPAVRACSTSMHSALCAGSGFHYFHSLHPRYVRRSYATGAPTEGAEPEIAEGVEGEEGQTRSERNPVDDPKDRSRVISWETSARYLKSEAYKATYGNDPVWKQYRRQHKGLWPKKLTINTCIKHNYITTANPCPGCRDEYLVFDYRNTDLLKQFISPYTGDVLSFQTTNLCQRKHYRLLVELEKARYFGTMPFKVPFVKFDYADYYEPLMKQYNVDIPLNNSNSADSSSSPSQTGIKQ